jgi:hypothetical protein
MEEKNLTLLTQDMELGKIFADSGAFPDVKTASQGVVKILAGREVGFSPMQAINSFYFVNGHLAMLAQAMGALIKKSGKYDYRILSHTKDGCSLAFFRINGKKQKLGESVFDKSMAAAAGIINKDNWKNYPMNMYFARALANGAKWFCPDAISGFYIVEELQDLEPEKKEIVVDIEKGEIKENA